MLYAKLADLGSGKICQQHLMHNLINILVPSRGEVTSIAYRSPKAYFNKPWTRAIDIWAWGIAVGVFPSHWITTEH